VFRPRHRLVSISQFNRRINSPHTRLILLQVHRELAGDLTAAAISYLDGKPLTVGVASKDRDAARGHVMGGFAKGYKLHAWMSEDRRIPLWCLTPLNRGEVPIARLLVEQIHQPLSERSLTLADSNYDAYDLHKELDACGGRLLVPLKQGPRDRSAASGVAAADGPRPTRTDPDATPTSAPGPIRVPPAHPCRGNPGQLVWLWRRIDHVAAMGATAASRTPLGRRQDHLVPCPLTRAGTTKTSRLMRKVVKHVLHKLMPLIPVPFYFLGVRRPIGRHARLRR
jgi:hypothetical protein